MQYVNWYISGLYRISTGDPDIYIYITCDATGAILIIGGRVNMSGVVSGVYININTANSSPAPGISVCDVLQCIKTDISAGDMVHQLVI